MFNIILVGFFFFFFLLFLFFCLFSGNHDTKSFYFVALFLTSGGYRHNCEYIRVSQKVHHKVFLFVLYFFPYVASKHKINFVDRERERSEKKRGGGGKRSRDKRSRLRESHRRARGGRGRERWGRGGETALHKMSRRGAGDDVWCFD